MNKKGFTLIEILAVIIIIGVVATIGIVAVSENVDKTKKTTIANLGRLYAESARSMRAKDRLPHDPKLDEATLIKIDALDGIVIDNNDDFDTGYGTVVIDNSYVAIVNDNYNYKYYVTILDDTNHAIVDVEYSEIDDDSVIADGNSKLSQIVNVSGLSNGSVVTINNTNYTVTDVHNKYIVLHK